MEKCRTLGTEKAKKVGQYFLFSYSPNSLKLVYGFTKPKQTYAEVSDELICKVIERVDYLLKNDPNHLRNVGFYSRTHWNLCPSTVNCPYIAKLVLDVFPYELIYRIKSQYS
jgi:hypothetical protein